MFAIRPFKLAALAAVTAAAGVLFVPLAVASPATAGTPMVTMPLASAVPLVGQYNQGPTFTATISATTIVQGGVLRFVIKGTVGGRQYVVTVFSAPMDIGTLTADAAGSASGSFSTAALDVGEHHIQVVAVNTGETVNIPFTVTAAQASPVPAGPPAGSNGGGLAFTGAGAVLPLGVVGVALMLGGGVFIVVSRRRQGDAARS